jgi:hypothetical protein
MWPIAHREFTIAPDEASRNLVVGYNHLKYPQYKCRGWCEQLYERWLDMQGKGAKGELSERLYRLSSFIKSDASVILSWQLMSALGSRIEYFKSLHEGGWRHGDYSESALYASVDKGKRASRGTLKVTKQSFLQVIDAAEGAALLCGLKGEVGERGSVYDFINSIPVRSGDFFKIPEGVPVGANAQVKKAIVVKSNPIPMIFLHQNDDESTPPLLLVAGALSVGALPIVRDADYSVDPVLIHGKIDRIEEGGVRVRYVEGQSVQMHEASFMKGAEQVLCVKKRSTVISVAALSGDIMVEANGSRLTCPEGYNVQVPAYLRKVKISSLSARPVRALITTPARTSAVGTISTSVLR